MLLKSREKLQQILLTAKPIYTKHHSHMLTGLRGMRSYMPPGERPVVLFLPRKLFAWEWTSVQNYKESAQKRLKKRSQRCGIHELAVEQGNPSHILLIAFLFTCMGEEPCPWLQSTTIPINRVMGEEGMLLLIFYIFLMSLSSPLLQLL